jgi:hypothetical protein
MKKILIMVGVLCLLVGMVSATDCAGYFTKAADKRIKFISETSSLELTIDRMNTRADRLYNTLDDMNSGENLTTAADDFTELVDRKNDASDDMSSLKSALDAYDNAVSDSRSDLPNACFKVFNMYDGDLSDLDDYYSNVRSAWNKFIPRYDIIAGYRSNLAAHTVSEAKPKVDDLRDYIGDVYDEVTNNLATTINATTGVTDEKIYNQTECFGMVTKNVDIATRDCVSKCNVAISKATQNCTQGAPQCPTCQDCTSVVLGVQQSLSECQSKLSGCNTQCPTCPVCVQGDTSAKDNEITRLNAQVTTLSSDLSVAKSNANDLMLKYNNATTQLAKTGICESCTLWKIGVVALIILIVAAWIIKM